MLRAELLLLAVAACSLGAPGDEELVGSCDDGIKNGGETAIDCGGPADTGCGAVRPCAVGQACQTGSDCVSGVCEGSTCGEGDCFDGFENGDESDVDCGGDECELCTAGKKCRSELDCENLCDTDADPPVCLGDTCENGVTDGDESDVDCGGLSCEYCGGGKHCNNDDDCESFQCTTGNECVSTCENGMIDGSESDTDCGGYDRACPRCEVGKLCLETLDCAPPAICTFDGMGVGHCS